MGASDPRRALRLLPGEAQPPIAPAEPWWRTSYLVSFAFHCNVACTFCMVEDALGRLGGTTLDRFRAFARGPNPLGGATRVVFSGGEVTLAKDLLAYVEVARSIPGVEHVRLQTNAIRLAEPGFLDRLASAGVDEYFVSLHADEPLLGDAMAQRPGSFEAILRGLEAVRASGATLLTNTAIVEANAARLPAIARLAASVEPRSIELWSYWPRADEEGDRAHAARVEDVRGPLVEAIEVAIAAGIPPVVKWFPRCLLGAHAWCQDDGQPPSLLEDEYWDREPAFGCLYEGVCVASMGRPQDPRRGPCAGLSDAYVLRHGWEERRLRPYRAEPPTRDDPARSLVERPGPSVAEAAIDEAWLAARGLASGAAIAGFALARAERGRGGGVVLTFASGERTAVVELAPIDPARRCFARAGGMDLWHRAVEDPDARAVGDLVRGVARAIEAARAR
jgi:cyclic pyranopterin phosphate synthase